MKTVRISAGAGYAGDRIEPAHQIFIGIAKNIVTAGFVLFEIEFVTLENGNQAGELIHHFFAAA